MVAVAPLEGVSVLEWTASAAGQIAGMLLADLGAEVVRVAPEGDGERTDLAGFLCWNRGKTLVDPAEPVESLVDRADVVVHDGTGAVAEARGHVTAVLRERAPALVTVWMPPTRSTYLGHELPHDQLLLDGISGFAANHPAIEERPVAVGAALLARARDGWGRSATVTGLHAEAAALATLVNESVDGPPKIAPGRAVTGGPYFRLYQGGDGRWFYLAALSPEIFIRALDVLDRLAVFALPNVAEEFLNFVKPEVGAEVNAELEATIAREPAAEWVRRLEGAGVPVALLSDPEEWLRSDVMAHACPPVTRRHPETGADVLMPGPPLELSDDEVRAGELPAPGALADAAQVWVGRAPSAPTGPPPGADDRPLAGLRVVDTATFLAGPFVSTLLGVHGADVVKVEPPRGRPVRHLLPLLPDRERAQAPAAARPGRRRRAGPLPRSGPRGRRGGGQPHRVEAGADGARTRGLRAGQPLAGAVPVALRDAEVAASIEAVTRGRAAQPLVEALLAADVPAVLAVERGHELDDPFLVAQDFSHVVETDGKARFRAAGGYIDWHHVGRRPPLPADQLAANVDALRARWSAAP